MSFDHEGDAGTAAALADALSEISRGEAQRVVDMIDNAPPGGIETRLPVSTRLPRPMPDAARTSWSGPLSFSRWQ